MTCRIVLVFICIFTFHANSSRAAEIEFVEGANAIWIVGDIEPGDSNKFDAVHRYVIENEKHAYVVLSA